MFPFSKVVIACWIVFWLYWLISAFGVKRNTNARLERFAGIRIITFALAVTLFRVLNIQNHSFQNHIANNSRAVLWVGFLVFLSGLFLAIWARIYLGKNWGMPMSQKQNPALVTSGPYHYIRHPIYSGILIAFLGSAIASSLFWLIVFAISGVYFIYSAVVEERLMMKLFPETYPAYKRSTKMLIPFVF